MALIYNTKIPFDNILDKEFQTLFLPFHTMQWIFLLPKYRFYENFLVFNSRQMDFISFFGVLIPAGIFILKALEYPMLQTNVTYNFLVSFDCICFCMGFLISYIFNLCYKKLNVGLVLNIQSIYRMFKFNKRVNINIFNAVSWFGLAVMFLYYASILAVYFYFMKMVFCDIPLCFCLIHFDLNIIYASRIVNLIENHLSLWVSDLDRLAAVSLAENKVFNDQTLKYMDDVANVQKTANFNCKQNIPREDWTSLLQGYRKILETYDMYKKAFQILILYNGVKDFLSLIMLVQYTIEIIFDTPRINIQLCNLAIAIVAVKSLVLLFIISFTNQRFYTSVEKAHCVCLKILNSKDGIAGNDARKTCKNILRLNNVVFEKMQACRLYTIDVPMPLQFICVVVDYIVVLIQFALGRK